MANGTTPPTGNPLLGSIMDAVTKFGFATVVAGVLLWFLLFRIMDGIRDAREGQRQIHELQKATLEACQRCAAHP